MLVIKSVFSQTCKQRPQHRERMKFDLPVKAFFFRCLFGPIYQKAGDLERLLLKVDHYSQVVVNSGLSVFVPFVSLLSDFKSGYYCK